MRLGGEVRTGQRVSPAAGVRARLDVSVDAGRVGPHRGLRVEHRRQALRRSPRARAGRPRRRLRVSATTAATRWPTKRTISSSTRVSGASSAGFSWRPVEKRASGTSAWVKTATTPGSARAAERSIASDPRVRMLRAQHLHVQQARHREVEGVGGAARDDGRRGGRRHAAPDRVAHPRRPRRRRCRRWRRGWRGSRCSGRGCPSAPCRGRASGPGRGRPPS